MASNYDVQTDDPDGQSGYGRKRQDKARRKLSRIHEAERLRKDNSWDRKWSDFIKIYSNQYEYAALEKYEDQVAPNMAFSTVNVIVPSIAVHSPKISVTAKQEEQVPTAEVVQAVVNHQWRQWNVQAEVAAAVKDFVIVGHGWLKVVWETKTEEKDLTMPEWQTQAQQALMERQMALQESDLAENEFPTPQEVVESLPKTRQVVTKDAPLVRRVSPFDVFVDPDATDIQDARWVAQRQLVPIEEARENEAWNKRARNKLKATVKSDARKDVEVYSEQIQASKESGFVVVWEYFDLIGNTICVLAEGCDDFLQDETPSPFTNGHPFVFVENYSVPERFYPIGDIEMIYGLQVELALTRTALVNDRKRGRRIHLFRSASIGPDGVEDLQGSEDNVMIDVVEDRPFNDIFTTIRAEGLDPQWYTQSEMIQNDIDLVSGVSEYARGAMPEIRRTATEAGLIQDAANARSSDKLYKVEMAMSAVAERMITLSQQYMDTEDVARVVSDDMVIGWVPYDREAIQGEFVFEVEAGSTQPQNESFKRQSALQMMDALAPLLGVVIDPARMAEHILRNGFGIKNAEEWIMAPPPVDPATGEVVDPNAPPEGGAPPPQ